MSKPHGVTIEEVEVTFSQEKDTWQDQAGDQLLKVTLERVDQQYYLWLETERWAIDGPDDLQALLQRVWAMAGVALPEATGATDKNEEDAQE